MDIDNISTIEDYCSFVNYVISKNYKMNEPNTKQKIIQPFIKFLGWDLITDVELEYSVNIGSNKRYVDYSLSTDKKPDIFIEVKKLNSNLKENNCKQLKSYLILENVDWGILTNGKHFKIMYRELIERDVVIKETQYISNEKLKDNKQIIKALSKECILNKDSRNISLKLQKSKILNLDSEYKNSKSEDISINDIIKKRFESNIKELVTQEDYRNSVSKQEIINNMEFEDENIAEEILKHLHKNEKYNIWKCGDNMYTYK